MNHQIAFQLKISLGDFNLHVKHHMTGNTLGIFGPSGSGKTSCLRILSGLEKASGFFQCNGLPIFDSTKNIWLPPRQRGIGYVPQDLRLFPHWNVRRNLLAGSASLEAVQKRLQEVIDILELDELLHRRITQLSGGEAQRVALGRALCAMPQLLLMDEPMASLDRRLRQRILPFIIRVREEFSLPIILVSHSATEIRSLCDEVLILEAGKVVHHGRPLDLLGSQLYPEGSRSERFENILEATVLQAESDTLSVAVDGLPHPIQLPYRPVKAGQHVRFGITASDLIVSTHPLHGVSARNHLPVRIERIEMTPDGGTILITQLSNPAKTSLVCEITKQSIQELSLQPGKEVQLYFKSTAVRNHF